MNKLSAAKGTLTVIENTELTSWILSGWALVCQVDAGHVRVRKVS